MIKYNKNKLDKIRRKHNLSLILLHGSFVDGKIHAKSDLDIAVLKDKTSLKLDILELINDLTNIFNNDRVDVTILNTADPLLSYSVAGKSKLLSGSKKEFDAYLFRSFHRYSDYLPFLKMERDFVLEKLKNYVTLE